jgi:putative hydrolase of the HAD superfamily
MTELNVKAILFDLGGVLIRLGGLLTMTGWTKWDEEEIWERWLSSTTVRLFESGKISAKKFSQEIIVEFNLPVSPDQFLTQFVAWPEGLYPGVNEFLSDLSSNYQIGCLSNTNTLHWDDLVNNEDFLQHFEFLFPSHLTGYLKPDPEAFTNAAGKMAIKTEEILFIDDNAINVNAALATGMVAYRAKGIEDVRHLLHRLNILY